MEISFKLLFLTLCATCLVRGSKPERDDLNFFRDMVAWLNSPKEEILEGVGNQQVSKVTKGEVLPVEESHHDAEGDHLTKSESEEYEKGVNAHAHKGYGDTVGYENGQKKSHSQSQKSEHESEKGSNHDDHGHKAQNSHAEDSGSKGHKGHSVNSEGHSNKGNNVDGYNELSYKEESGREKKFFDNGEDLEYNSDHDHLQAYHKAENKGGFKGEFSEKLQNHDNHGKKLYKNRDELFEKALKEKDSHGNRKDYGKKTDFNREGRHEGISKKSSGDHLDSNGAHSLLRPIRLRDKKKNIRSQPNAIDSDNDPIQASHSSVVPLATVLEEAGFGQKLIAMPNKNITVKKVLNANKKKSTRKSPLKPIRNKRVQDTQQDISPPLESVSEDESNLLRKRPSLKSLRKQRLISRSGKLTSEDTSTLKNKEVKAKDNSTDNKNVSKKIPDTNKHPSEKKLPNSRKKLSTKLKIPNISRNFSENVVPEASKKRIKKIPNKTQLKPNGKEPLSKKPHNDSLVSLFLFQNKLNKKKDSAKLDEGKHAGHKKHHLSKPSKKNSKLSMKENNEIHQNNMADRHPDPSVKKKILLKDPFITTTHSSKDASGKPAPKTKGPKRVSDQPLQEDKSQQISVVSNRELEPSSTHDGHKPKNYKHFESSDKGHHKQTSAKSEKGGHESSGYKGKVESDHGKLHDSGFVDKGKKYEKGHDHEKHYDGHFDKGEKSSKGHAHGKKGHSHKGHSDKGFKNVHKKLEYAVKKNFYHDDDLKKSHKIFDDFDAVFEKKKQDNLKAHKFYGGDYHKDFNHKGYHHDDHHHNHKKGNDRHYGYNDHHNQYHNHGHKSHNNKHHNDHYHNHNDHYHKGNKHGYNDYDYY